MNPLIALKLAASTVQVPFDLLRAICTVESNLDYLAVNQFDGNSPSHGMCQVKYDTAKQVGFKGTIKQLYNPLTNALYAAKYLKHQLNRYKGDWVKSVSAYNRGTFSPTNAGYVKKVFNHLFPKENVNGGSRRKNKEYFNSPRKYNNPLKELKLARDTRRAS